MPRSTLVHAARGALHQARQAFHAGEHQEARWWFLDAAGYFGKAGAAHLAARAEAIGRLVIDFQRAGGLPVGAARAPKAPAGRIVWW